MRPGLPGLNRTGMPEFNLPFDIGERALMHVGSSIGAAANAAFPGNPKAAALLAACYGKLRRAELGRNLWTFATRKTAIRPIDTNTMLLAATLWSGSVTYFVGSIVSDAVGTLWKSTIRNNLNNQPGNVFSAWVPFFGPMTVEPFDSSKAYFAGELVYTFGGDGTYNVFESLSSANSLHPALPNQWSVDTIYLTNQVVQQFPAWASGTSYSKGNGALYTDGNVYVSLANSNLNNIPPSSPADWILLPTLTLQSQLMPTALFSAPPATGTTPIDEWQPETVYSLGSFAIYKAAVYVSLASANTANYPNSSSQWAAVTNGTLYQSLIDLNQGNSPSSTPANWSAVTSYSIGNTVAASDGYNYTSLVNSNLNNNPANNANPTDWLQGSYTAWTTTIGAGGGNSQWLEIGGAAFPNGVGLTAIGANTWPIGSGPLSQTATKNAYRLPAGYLRRAPQDPSAGRISWLGVPGNLPATDWSYEGSYITTWNGAPIVLRFVADVQNVQEFPDLFCEGLGCRIGLEVCEPLTQSTAKLQGIGQQYKLFMTEARTVGGIEAGPIEPPLDDLITCRA